MGRINFAIDDDLEQEFRKTVARRYGARKGALSIALSEAIRLWIAKTKAELREWEEV